jgi:hypothetical protein
MATQITLTIKKHQKKFEETKAALMLDGPQLFSIERVRLKVGKLRHEALHSKTKKRRFSAFREIMEIANVLKAKMNGRKNQYLSECFDACHLSLETIAQESNDVSLRNRAFEYIKGNSIALKLTIELAKHEDIRKKAKAAMPRSPDENYSMIGQRVESEETSIKKAISRRILAHLRKDKMDKAERKKILREARIILKDSLVHWGKTPTLIQDLKRVINEAREKRHLRKIGDDGLAKYISAYLRKNNGVVPIDYSEALDRVKKMRMEQAKSE